MMKKILKTVFLCALLFSASHVFAAKVILSNSKETIHSGEQFSVDVLLDTEGQTINAVGGKLVFPPEMLSINSISTLDSVVNLWLADPSTLVNDANKSGSIDWGGIIPGGFSGVLSPFYKGSKSGVLFRVVFTPRATGNAELFFQDLDNRLNDGQGTPATTTSSPLALTFIPGSVIGYPLLPQSTEDAPVPLSDFDARIGMDPTINNGAPFVVFHDNTSRVTVDHYEVALTSDMTPPTSTSKLWQTETSPYVLGRAGDTRFVQIKSVAVGGAERVVTLSLGKAPQSSAIRYILLSTAGIILLFLVLLRVRKVWGK